LGDRASAYSDQVSSLIPWFTLFSIDSEGIRARPQPRAFETRGAAKPGTDHFNIADRVLAGPPCLSSPPARADRPIDRPLGGASKIRLCRLRSRSPVANLDRLRPQFGSFWKPSVADAERSTTNLMVY
jgi:hypothetical protein